MFDRPMRTLPSGPALDALNQQFQAMMIPHASHPVPAREPGFHPQWANNPSYQPPGYVIARDALMHRRIDDSGMGPAVMPTKNPGFVDDSGMAPALDRGPKNRGFINDSGMAPPVMKPRGFIDDSGMGRPPLQNSSSDVFNALRLAILQQQQGGAFRPGTGG